MPNIFQSPPGTRDFFPEEMALRRYIEDTWRRVSLRHGFVEVDGPTFEYLDLYKVKSGDEIVSQLFHFESREDKSGNSESFALRPEFTPTLARMVAKKANTLPRPIKWFSIPRCYRAERQQRGRLKEFFQWNVDMLGGETPEIRRQFDLEVAALCLDCLREFGLSDDNMVLRWNDRTLMHNLLKAAAIPDEQFPIAFHLLDRAAKLTIAQRTALYNENNIATSAQLFFERISKGEDPSNREFWQSMDPQSGTMIYANYAIEINQIKDTINNTFSLIGLEDFVKYDASIVRGLAYYTGFVFEISDTKGDHRAIAGGGRYDKLIEMFGGPSLPATGFGMGDVVLENLLTELGKMPKSFTTPSDVFVINALPTADESIKLTGQLRAEKFAVAVTYKSTKNIGKLLQEAANSGAKLALILAPAEWDKPGGPFLKLKNLATREEKEIPRDSVLEAVRTALKS